MTLTGEPEHELLLVSPPIKGSASEFHTFVSVDASMQTVMDGDTPEDIDALLILGDLVSLNH